MNREIKFRAWDKKDKVMRGVYAVEFKRISNKGNRDRDMVEMHCSDYEGSRAIILYHAFTATPSGEKRRADLRFSIVGSTFSYPMPSHFERPLEEVELMQFTGLKDKNGKEIYEGDVIAKLHSDWPSCSNCHNSPQEHMKSLEVRYEVVFKSGQFLGMRNTGKYNPWETDNDGNTHTKLYSGTHGYVEIIGNIYENPDLLK